MEKYNKLIYALLAALILALGATYTALEDDIISKMEWVNVFSVFLGPIMVYVAPKNENGQLNRNDIYPN